MSKIPFHLKAFAPTKEKSDETRLIVNQMMKDSLGVDPSEWTPMLSVHIKSGILSKKVYLYLLALDQNGHRLIVATLDKNGQYVDHETVDKDDLQGIKKSMSGEYVLNLSKLGKVHVAPSYFVSKKMFAGYGLDMLQEDEADVFMAFFKSLKA